MNTPVIETERLLLRKFDERDMRALFRIYSDPQVNTYLPWFPLQSMEEAKKLFSEKYAAAYAAPCGYRYAVCLKSDDIPIGYVHVNIEENHDLGYGLCREFWHRGITREAAQAVVAQVKRDGMAYITATHDVNNPRSGNVMKALGMRYQYSYEELWQPKNFPVVFRMYQLNLDGDESRVYRAYWEKYERHFIEKL